MSLIVPIHVQHALELLCKTPKPILDLLLKECAGEVQLQTLRNALDESCNAYPATASGVIEPDTERPRETRLELTGNCSAERVSSQARDPTSGGGCVENYQSRGSGGTQPQQEEVLQSHIAHESQSLVREVYQSAEAKILLRYNSMVKDVRSLVAMDSPEAVGDSPCNGDPRLIDLRESCKTLTDHLRRGLSQLSLAQQLDEYEREYHKISTTDLIIHDRSYASNRRRHITDFIHHQRYTKEQSGSVRKALTNGTKILVLKASTTDFPVLTLFALLTFWKSRAATYEEIELLTSFLRQEKKEVDKGQCSGSPDSPLADLIQFAAIQDHDTHGPWLDQTLYHYKAQCGEVRKRLHSSASCEPEVAKRPRRRGSFANEGSIEADLDIEPNSHIPLAADTCTEDTATDSTSNSGTESGDTTPRSQTADGSESPGFPSCPSGSRAPLSAHHTMTNDLGFPQQQMMDKNAIQRRDTNSAHITDDVHASPNRSQMERVGRHDLHHIDNITDGGNFGCEVSNSPVITIMPMNDTTEVRNYQRPVVASESTMGNWATHRQVEYGFVQQDCVTPTLLRPASTSIPQPSSLHEKEQPNMVAMDVNSQWSTWSFENDMPMAPNCDFDDDMAMVQNWGNQSTMEFDFASASFVGFPYTEISKSTT